jgi:aryl-alcohol dehydrogenase-like predicted oxidoreductase
MKMIGNISAMTLGTVQLGMNYGIANDGGKPDEAKSFAILRSALENGVTALDTARAYGDSEEVIGRFLKQWEGEMPYICTKVPPIPAEYADKIEEFVVQSVKTSLKNLGVAKVGAVMLHSAPDVEKYGQPLADAMGKLLELGYAEQVGVSVYDNAQIEEMLKYDVYTVTQVPMSIFDQRLIANGAVKNLKERGVTVFVRSVFLQGLFFLDPDKITDPILVEHAAPKIRLLREIAAQEGLNVAQLAIAFMRDCVGITSLVLGADTPDQVKSNIEYFNVPTLKESTMEVLQREFANVDIPAIMQVLSRPKQ